MLGVHDLGLAGAVAEEPGVEQLGVLDGRPGRHVGRIVQQGGIDPGGQQLLAAEEGDRFDAGARFSQNRSRFRIAAPGNRPAIPTMAIALVSLITQHLEDDSHRCSQTT